MRLFLFGVIAISLSFLVLSVWNESYDANLRDAIVANGWVLAAGMGIQLLMRLKTVKPHWLVGPVIFWDRLHIGLGCLVILAFGLHTSWSVPDTGFEWVLWALFVLVAGSGIVGAWLSRAIPFRVEQKFQRLPVEELTTRQSKISQQAETLALTSLDGAGSLAVSTLYADHLHSFFRTPQNGLAHLKGSRKPLKQLLFELQSVERNASQSEQNVLKEMRVLVEDKDRLDFQHAHEATLQAWRFVHLPATYALIAMTLAHVAIVYAFTSGAR